MSLVLLAIIVFLISTASIATEENQEIPKIVNPEAILEIELEKYSNFSVHNKKGTIAQYNLKTGVTTNNVELKETSIIAKIPTIDGELPQNVEVITNRTNATGISETVKTNYEYNNAGILKINTKNEGDTGIAKTDDTARDEYTVIAIYPEKTYQTEKTSRDISMQAVVMENFYDANLGTITKEQGFNIQVSEDIGAIISSKLQTEEIYNGYIKANTVYKTKYETTYRENANIEISCKELQDELIIEQENNYIDENEKNIENEQKIYYQKTKIVKNNVLDILGEEGKLEILKEDGTLIYEINKDTEVTEEGIVEINYEGNLEKIILKTSQPKKVGTIKIQHTKVIPSTFTNLKVSSIKTIQTIYSEKEENETQTIQLERDIQNISTEEKITKIEEAKNEIEMQVDKQSLTNETTNDILFTAILKEDGEKNNLYNNPVIKINLPTEVEKVVLGDISILYTDELSVNNSEVKENEDGTKTIEITLQGTQKSYLDDKTNSGMYVSIPANIILKKDLEAKEGIITTSLKNNPISINGYIQEETAGNELKLAYIQKVEETNDQEKTQNTLNESTGNGTTGNGTTESEAVNIENSKKINSKLAKQNVEEIKAKNGLQLKCYAQVGDKVLENGESIHDSEIIKYVVEVTNTTDTAIENLDIVCQVPDGTTYATVDIGSFYNENYEYVEDSSVKEYTFSTKKLEAGESKVGFYEVVVQDLAEGQESKDILNEINAKIQGEVINNIILQNSIIDSNLKVYLRSYINRDTKNSFVYFIDVTNLTNETMTDVQVISDEFQEEMNVLKVFYYDDYSDGLEPFGSIVNGKLEGTINKIEPNQTRTIEIMFWAGNFKQNVNEVLLSMSINVFTSDNNKYYSNENRRNAYPEYVTIEKSLDREGESVKSGEEINYTITINNPSKIKTYIRVEDYLPEEIQGISLTYEKYNIEEDSEEQTEYDIEKETNLKYTIETVEKDLSTNLIGKAQVDEDLVIPAGKSVVLYIKAKTLPILGAKKVENYAKVTGTYIKTVTSNVVEFTLLSAYDDNSDISSEEPEEKIEKNSISGLVWVDENENGQRDGQENRLNGINVKLYDVETQSIAKNSVGEVQITTTDDNGEYKFKDVENGSYWVLFEYNTNQYRITTYQKQNVSVIYNSDVIKKEVNIDGITKTVGITDTLIINNNGIAHVDMGLISNDEFDFSIDKYITKINIDTPSENREYTYNKEQFAKIEIKAKNLNSTSIKVEYTIQISNNGNVDGYITKIVDKLPEGFEFDNTLNKGWLKDESGSLVNTSLSNEIIQANEKKELKLILTRKMTEDSTGNVVNIAQIVETKNMQNLSEDNNENNQSSAELIISVETGILNYTIVAIGVIIGLIIIVLIFKGKIRTNKNFKFILMIIITIGIFTTNSYAEILDIRYKDENTSNAKFVDYNNWGRTFECGHADWHSCWTGYHLYDTSNAIHYYSNGSRVPQPLIEYQHTTYSETIRVKNVNLQQEASNVDSIGFDENYNLVGPFVVQINTTESFINSISLVYTEKGIVKEINDASVLVDKMGDKISLNLVQNERKEIYIKVSTETEKINSLKLNVTVKNTTKIIKTDKYKKTYYCFAVQPGRVHNIETTGAAERTPEKTQPMYEYEEIKSEIPYDENIPIQFGEVLIKGRAELEKIDATTQKPLDEVEFTLKMAEGKEAGSYVTIDENGNAVYSKEEKTIKTDSEGKIQIKLLWHGKYQLTEVANPHYGYEDLPKVYSKEIIINPGRKTTITMENTRTYIKVSGTVWEDIIYSDGKGYYSNSLYKNGQLDTEDKELEHVTVNLRHKTNANLERQTTTDANGAYLFDDVLIDELENYYIEFIYNGMCYKSILIDPQEKGVNSENYNATQEYEDSRSKALEGQRRAEFNENYAIITNNASRDNKNKKMYDLEYESQNHISTLTYGKNAKDSDAYGYEGQKYPITKVDDQYLISATTLDAYDGGGLNNVLIKLENDSSYQYVKATAQTIRENGVEEIPHINLGVQEREQPDLRIEKDLNNVKIAINDKFQIYKYRLTMEDEEHELGEVGVKFEAKSNGSYSRAIYEPDRTYENPADPSKELEVYVTYEIKITNSSTNLVTKVGDIVDYYDRNYSVVAVGDDLNENTSVVSTKNDSNGNGTVAVDKYITYVATPEALEAQGIDSTKYDLLGIQVNEILEPQTAKTIYVQFKLDRKAVNEVINDKANLANVCEIDSYSVYENIENAKKDIHYAGIDFDSNPGNATPGDIDTYEDDTDLSYTFKLVTDVVNLKNTRAISGTVFEDNPTFGVDDEIHTNEIRQGNGIYDNNEKQIEGIKVTLKNKEDNSIAKVYTEKDGKKQWVEAETTTDANGNYAIQGFIPGDYYITYTWGSGYNESYPVEKYKSTVVNERLFQLKYWNKDWYSQNFSTKVEKGDRYSDAIDSYEKRKEIDELDQEPNIKTLNHETNYNTGNEMESVTQEMDMGVEMIPDIAMVYIKGLEVPAEEESQTPIIEDGQVAYEFKVENVDFGLVERPRQQLEIEKTIKKLTMRLADGRIMANIELDENGDIINKTSNVAYVKPNDTDPGMVKVEVDNEFIQSSNVLVTYEIKVTNTSETDYADEKFYIYGNVPENKSSLMKLVPQKIIDYVDDTWVYNESSSNIWEIKQLKDVKNENWVTEEVQKTIRNSNVKILYSDYLNTKQLEPTQTASLSVDFTKLLTTTDEIAFNNQVEIISVGKTGGKTTLYQEIPGNYEPVNADQEPDDAQASQAIIVPSTGANLNYIPLVILIISSCSILIVGTILIKKLVLGEYKKL